MRMIDKFENLISAVISTSNMKINVRSNNMMKVIFQTVDKDKKRKHSVRFMTHFGR